MELFSRIKRIYSGQSITRILLNESFKETKLIGEVLDIGGARNPDYFNYFDISLLQKVTIVDGKLNNIDFEIDNLPYNTESFDTVICANVLEHIFNYQHLVNESFRVLEKKGFLVGFVPFLIQYHPDPHDYFRYTDESLKKIFMQAGFSHVEIKKIGLGPLMINFNNIMFMFPKSLRSVIAIPYFIFSKILVRLKPALIQRYPIGYTFICLK